MASRRPSDRSRISRTWLAPLALSLLLLITTFGLATAPSASPVRGSPIGPAATAAHATPPALPPPPPPNCTGGSYPWLTVDLAINGIGSNASGNNSGWVVGPAPVNVTANITLSGCAGTFGYMMSWGDSVSNGTWSYFYQANASVNVITLTHFYVKPAYYTPYVAANLSTASNGIMYSGASGNLQVYGTGGPNPIIVTTNVTNGTVPLNVTYTAAIAGAPANATELWFLAVSSDPALTYSTSLSVDPINNSTWAVELLVPGLFSGSLQVDYPGLSLVYAEVNLPSINVLPLAFANITHSPVSGGSPWNITYWANATNLSGGPLGVSATVDWQFQDTFPWFNGSNPYYWAQGPTNGSPIWREYFLNLSGGWGVSATASLVRSDGVIMAIQTVFLALNTPWVGPPPWLALTATPNNGTGPLSTTVNVTLYQYTNSSLPLELVLGAVYLGQSNSSSFVWNYTVPSWTGGTLSFPLTLSTPGLYRIGGNVVQNVSGSMNWITGANTSVWVFAPAPAPPSLSFSASPNNGSAPLNVTLSLVAVGGVAPYNLSICREGPFAYPNGTGTCTTVASVSAWNGSALSQQLSLNTSGNYSIYATVSDSLGRNSTALASITVWPPGAVPPLKVHASFVAPNAATTEGATYGFQTVVTGGVAPYNIQWTFGDGSSGSALAGTIALHTYTASGSYIATLTVTDARLVRATTTVGPVVVSIPLSASPAVPWWETSAVLGLAAVVGVASAAVIGVTLRRLAQRREALNWLRELESRESVGPSETAPK